MSKSNCCIPQFLCGVQGTKTNCTGFVPGLDSGKFCNHINAMGNCTCALMIAEKVALLHIAFTKVGQ